MRRPPFTFAALALLLATGSLGCGSTLQVPSCPNPVLLGPVDRIGGHRAEAPRQVTTIDRDVEKTVHFNPSILHFSRTSDEAGRDELGIAAVERTEGRADRDIRIEHLPVGAWAFVAGGVFVMSEWAGVAGQIVEVPRGR